MSQLLFVCTANVCRSPMAAAVFNALASEAGISHRAQSAGIAALEDDDIEPRARTALEEIGFYPGVHRARQVDEAMIREADLVLAMTPQHVAVLRRLSAASPAKVQTLLGYATGTPDAEGIPDPHGQSTIAYRASVRRILECLHLVIARLGNEDFFAPSGQYLLESQPRP